jgi:hypothetical protein
MQGQCKVNRVVCVSFETDASTVNHFGRFAPEDIPYAKKRERYRSISAPKPF